MEALASHYSRLGYSKLEQRIPDDLLTELEGLFPESGPEQRLLGSRTRFPIENLESRIEICKIPLRRSEGGLNKRNLTYCTTMYLVDSECLPLKSVINLIGAVPLNPPGTMILKVIRSLPRAS